MRVYPDDAVFSLTSGGGQADIWIYKTYDELTLDLMRIMSHEFRLDRDDNAKEFVDYCDWRVFSSRKVCV